MRTLLTLLALTSGAALLGQTADVTKGCAPLLVNFTAPAGVNSFFWDFKDGASSNIRNPANIFNKPGTYVVEFRETPGDPVIGTVPITVFPRPEVFVIAQPPSGCAPLSVTFSDSIALSGDISILGRSWVFGDGAAGAGVTPAHVYTSAGIFTVSVALTTNYSSCNVTQVFPNLVKVGVKPNANFTASPAPPVACQPPLTVSFTNTTSGGSGTLTYRWDFGNGDTSILVNPPAQTYTQLGTYTVTLTATDTVGCSASVTRTVRVGPPAAAFSTANDTVCLNAPVAFANASESGIYEWTFGPGASPQTSQATNPTVVFSTPGLRNITLKVTGLGNCTTTVTQPLFVEDASAAFIASPSYSCSDPTLFTFTSTSPNANSWEWTFSDGSTATGPTASFLWRVPDTSGYSSLGMWLDTVRLRIQTPAGCEAQSLLVDTIWRPNARFMPNVQRGCAPLTVTFFDSSTSREPIVRRTWLFDDGTVPLTFANDAPVPHTFLAPGDYRVRLVIENDAGCIDTSYAVLIEVGEPIAGDFTADKTAICPGDTVQFTALTTDPRIDGWHFSSESDRLWHCFQNQNPTWVYRSETGELSVSLTTEYNGCFFTVTKENFIRVKGPIARIHYQTSCDNERLFTFTNKSQEATIVTWYLGDGDSTTVDSTFTHLYASPKDYTVVLKAENPSSGCPPSYDTAVVCPRVLEAKFTLPDTICGGQVQTLDASASTGVNATCYKGYTWYFSFQRPIRTDEPTLDIPLGPSGPQTISLEVESVNGCRDTLERQIFIYNNSPQIAADKTEICIPATVSFKDLSTAEAGIVKWEWNFGDGTTSKDTNPTHTFRTPPPNGQFFNVELRIEDAFGCVGYAQLPINVYRPVSIISTLPSPAHLCAGDTLRLQASDFTAGGSNLSWSWDLGNGQTAIGQTAGTAYGAAGQYTIKLVFTEVATGCKDSTFTTVQVQAPPQAAFASSVDGVGVICYPQNVTFTNTTSSGVPLTILWDLGNGVQVAGNQAATVFPKGTFTVRMVAITPFGCRDTVARSFNVVGPEGTFEMDKNLICVGDSILFRLKDTASVSSWEWSFGDGTTAGKVNPVRHVYTFRPPTNSTVARLVLKGQNDACAISVEKPVNFSPVRAQFAIGPSPCVGAPVQFFNTSTDADLSAWNFGDGGTSNLFNPTHTFLAKGNYTVTLVVTDLPLGCRDTLRQVVTVGGIAGLQLFGDTICAGDTALIGIAAPALPNATFNWQPANLVLPPQNAAIVRVRPNQTTEFTVNILEASGCRDTGRVTVVVPTAYDGARDLDTLISKGSSVLLPVTAASGYVFTWAPADPGTPPLVRPDTSVTYTLTVRDVLRCTERRYTFRIQVVPERVYAPNAFTPNGDGDNDVFRLLADGDDALVRLLILRVYNRWGEMVYEGSGALDRIGWDGTHNGKPAPSDVYAWLAEVEFLTGKKVLLKGDLTLLR